MALSSLQKITALLLTGSLLACFGGGDDIDDDVAAPLTCSEASAEEAGTLLGLDASCTMDSDCTVVATGCGCPTPVNTSNDLDEYMRIRQRAQDTCKEAYTQSCNETQCAFEVDESSVVCNQGTCGPPPETN